MSHAEIKKPGVKHRAKGSSRVGTTTNEPYETNLILCNKISGVKYARRAISVLKGASAARHGGFECVDSSHARVIMNMRRLRVSQYRSEGQAGCCANEDGDFFHSWNPPFV